MTCRFRWKTRECGLLLRFQWRISFSVAVCCSELQCVAVSCSVLQTRECGLLLRFQWHISFSVAVCCSVLQWVAVQCVAVSSSVLQCVAVCPNVFFRVPPAIVLLYPLSVLQCVAVCCSMLQYVAVCCSVLQCVAVHCRVSQCVQCVAVCRCLRLSWWSVSNFGCLSFRI